MNRNELAKFIRRPEATTRASATDDVVDFHRTRVMAELGRTYRLVDEVVWPTGPLRRADASTRIVITRPSVYVEPHIEDHDQIQLFLGEPTRPNSLTVEITLEDQQFTVTSPCIAIYPKGLKHAEHCVAGAGWLLTIHFAQHCVNYRDPAPSPVEVGATYEVDIEEASREGQGIARLHDCVVFVPNAKPGDHVKVKILRRSQLAADAEILP